MNGIAKRVAPTKCILNMLVCFVAAFGSAEAFSSSSPSPGEPRWQDQSRQAQAALHKGKFAESIAGCQRALLLARRQGASSDQQCDLQLILVDVYIRAGKFGSADTLLDQVEPYVRSTKFYDAMLPARYLRRRYRLSLSERRYEDTVYYLKQIFELQEKHFHRDSAVMAETAALVLRAANTVQDWNTISLILTKWQKESLNQTLPVPLIEVVATSLEMLAGEAHGALLHDDLEKAVRILKFSSPVDPRVDRTLAGWSTMIRQSLRKGQLLYSNAALDQIQQLLKIAERRPPTVALLEARVAAHRALADMYHARRRPRERALEVEKALRLLPLSKEPATVADARRVHDDCLVVAVYNVSCKHSDEETVIPYLKRALQLSDRLSTPEAHVQPRFGLAQAYMRKGELSLAEEVLKSIDVDKLSKLGNYRPRMARYHLMFADNYSKIGNTQKAREHVIEARRWLAGQPESKRYKEVWTNCSEAEARFGIDAN